MDYFLREISREDLVELNRWRNDPAIVEQLHSPFRYIGIDVDNAWYDSYLLSRNTCVRLGIADRITNEIIGAVYLVDIDWLVRSADFGIMIGRADLQGLGIGRFATLRMLEHAFLDLGLNRVSLTVFPENAKAYRLYKSAGFVEEGTLREVAFKRGRYRDMIQMSILASEWR